MSPPSVESRIDGFLGKHEAAIEAQLREARSRLRESFSRGFELVFDNYSALVFGTSPSERTPDAFISIAGYPKRVTLFFLHGAGLATRASCSKVTANKCEASGSRRRPTSIGRR